MKFTAIMFCVVTLNLLAACNTIGGIGEDVEAGGNKLENTAEKHQNY